MDTNPSAVPPAPVPALTAEDQSLNWLLAMGGKAGPPPFSTRTHTPGSFRLMKFKRAFLSIFVFDGLIILGAIVYAGYTLWTAPSFAAACKTLVDAPRNTMWLLVGHLIATVIYFVLAGGLGGGELARAEHRLAIDATPQDLTIAAGDGRRNSGPWLNWLIGPIERNYTAGEGPEVYPLAAFWLQLIERDGKRGPGFRIDPDYLVGEKRSAARIVRTLLDAAKSAGRT